MLLKELLIILLLSFGPTVLWAQSAVLQASQSFDLPILAGNWDGDGEFSKVQFYRGGASYLLRASDEIKYSQHFFGNKDQGIRPYKKYLLRFYIKAAEGTVTNQDVQIRFSNESKISNRKITALKQADNWLAIEASFQSHETLDPSQFWFAIIANGTALYIDEISLHEESLITSGFLVGALHLDSSGALKLSLDKIVCLEGERFEVKVRARDRKQIARLSIRNLNVITTDKVLFQSQLEELHPSALWRLGYLLCPSEGLVYTEKLTILSLSFEILPDNWATSERYEIETELLLDRITDYL